MPTRYFFLTAADYGDWLGQIEVEQNLLYCPTDGEGPTPTIIHTYRDIPNLGTPPVNRNGVSTADRIAVHPTPHRFRAKVTQLKDGSGCVYSLTESSYSGCITFIPGGCGPSNYIMPGELSDVRGDPLSRKLFSKLLRALHTVCFVKDSVAVGREAAALHFAGYRLCKGPLALPEYDFNLPPP